MFNMSNMRSQLAPFHDSRKSFYGKATVEHEGDSDVLYSYNTRVAEVNNSTRTAKVHGTYSPTTLRHIKEFLKQHGYRADSKSQIEKDYMK